MGETSKQTTRHNNTTTMMKLAFAITLVIAAVACAHESHFSEDAFSSQDIVPENDGAAAPTSEFATAETESTPAAPAQEAVQAKATWGRRRRRYLRRRRTTKKKARTTKKKARTTKKKAHCRACRKTAKEMSDERAAKKKARKGYLCTVTPAVKRLGSYLKRLATKLCRKVNRRVVKKTHEYVRKNVRKFCIKTCIKSTGKVYLLGGGSPAADFVAAALGRGSKSGCNCACKNSFKAMVRKIRHQYMSGATMDEFVADNICAFVGLDPRKYEVSRRRRFRL